MDQFLSTVNTAWVGLPGAVKAILIAGAGWLMAIFLRFITIKLLAILRFDVLCRKTGFTEFLRKGNVQHPPSRLVGILVFWLIVATTIFNAAAALDIAIVHAVSAQLAALVPSLLAAILIVVVGALVVTFLANFALTIARNAGMPNASFIVKAGKYLGNILVVTLALEQIGFGRTIINSLFLILLAAFAFGLALAFGLGCKDMARDAMESFVQTMRERSRDKGSADLEG